MKSPAVALVVVAGGLLAIGCSSSTGPSDSFVGAWRVTAPWMVLNSSPPDTGTLVPASFTLTITKSGQTYAAASATLTWAFTWNGTAYQYLFPASDSVAGSTVTVSGDTLVLRIPVPVVGTGCELSITGAYQGRNARGLLDLFGGDCGTVDAPPATAAWTATKQ